MSIKIEGRDGIVCRVPESRFGYFGWPSIARMDDGTLVVAASGLRHAHICPWGTDTVAFSYDEGLTWTEPYVVNDTPLDDRDAGIVYLGGKALLLTWFTLDPRLFHERFVKQFSDPMRRRMEARLSTLTDATVAQHQGSWTRLSMDGGLTWTAPRRAPVTAPHGPIVLSSGVLMYAGKLFDDTDSRPLGRALRVCISIDMGATWKEIGTVPSPEKYGYDNTHEAHLVELKDGTLLCAMRIEEGDTLATWMSRSTDRGYTWCEPWRLPCDGSPPHLLMHSSGRIVCVYGYRHAPYGQRALVGRDGEHWDEELILRDDGPDGDLGYPASVEMPDGSILTVFYQRLPGDAKCSILSTRWRLPD